MSNSDFIPEIQSDIGDEVNLEVDTAEEKDKQDFEANKEDKGEYYEHKHISSSRNTREDRDAAQDSAISPSTSHKHEEDGLYYRDSKDVDSDHILEVNNNKGEGADEVDRRSRMDVADIDVSSPAKCSVGSRSPAKSAMSTTMKPMLYLTWDGEEDSRANVMKLKKFLRTKGYIIFEHAGDNSIAEGVPLSPTTTTEGPLTQETTTTADSLESARAPVSKEVSEKIKLCTVFVSCVTRRFTFNLNCKNWFYTAESLWSRTGSTHLRCSM